MFRFQSGPWLAAGSPLKPLRPSAASACVTLGTALVALLAPFAASSQTQTQTQTQTQAQQARQASGLRPDPLNAQASVPLLVHESAFTQYRRLGDVTVGSWRDANDTVNRIGGWRAYAREAAGPASSPAAPPAASPAAPAAANTNTNTNANGSASAPGMKPSEPAKAVPKSGAKDPHAGHKMK